MRSSDVQTRDVNDANYFGWPQNTDSSPMKTKVRVTPHRAMAGTSGENVDVAVLCSP